MKLYGLIGYPLGHSFSQRYFTDKFAAAGIADCAYRNFPIETIEGVETVLQTPGLRGFNVTIPYKQAIVPYLSGLSDEARAIGAVNCVKITPEGLTGYNTDAYGFRRFRRGIARRKKRSVHLRRPLRRDRTRSPADRQCHAAGHFPERGRLSRPAVRSPRRRAFPVRPGIQPGSHRISEARRGAGGCNPQRLRHAGRAGRKSMGDLERIIVRTIQKRKRLSLSATASFVFYYR